MQEVFEKIIERFKSEVNYNDGAEIGLKQAIEIVKQEAEMYDNGWIPCSVRLPEDEQVVLTCKYKSISILRYSTKTNHWYELSGNWWWSANMVTAWQPLPEPYQPK